MATTTQVAAVVVTAAAAAAQELVEMLLWGFLPLEGWFLMKRISTRIKINHSIHILKLSMVVLPTT